MRLNTPILRKEINIAHFRLINPQLEVTLTSGNTQQIDTAVLFSNQFEASKQTTLPLDGKIFFNTTHGSFNLKTSKSWTSALDINFLRIENFEITGTLGSNLSDMYNLQAAGFGVWGIDCINSDQKNTLLFNKADCSISKVEVSLNNTDVSKSHLNGVYKDIEPMKLIKWVAHTGEDQPELPKQFLLNKFNNYVDLAYTPAVTENVFLEASSRSKSLGSEIFIKGASKMLGLEGMTNLRIKPQTKDIVGLFRFGIAYVMFDNVLLKGNRLAGVNSIEMIIPRSQSGNMQMNSRVNIFGLEGAAEWKFLDELTTMNALIYSTVFHNISITGVTNDIEDLKQANFKLEGIVKSDL